MMTTTLRLRVILDLSETHVSDCASCGIVVCNPMVDSLDELKARIAKVVDARLWLSTIGRGCAKGFTLFLVEGVAEADQGHRFEVHSTDVLRDNDLLMMRARPMSRLPVHYPQIYKTPVLPYV